MKALFVGLGSVGQRHLANFKSLAGGDARIWACRHSGHGTVIVDGVATQVPSLAAHYGLEGEVDSLEKGLALKPDVVVVSNPSSLHVGVALEAVRHGCHVFIEKPLGASLEGVSELEEEAARQGVVVTVGYQMRFHPCFQAVRRMVRSGEYGGLVAAQFDWGAYFPRFHTYEDYRSGYMARRELGGGVVLCFIHEVDMMLALLGPLEVKAAAGGNLGGLEIDVEDTASALLCADGAHGPAPVTLTLSCVQTHETRAFKLEMLRGTICCDMVAQKVEAYDVDGGLAAVADHAGFVRNDLFVAIMRDFLEAVEQGRSPLSPLSAGVESLELALDIIGRL